MSARADPRIHVAIPLFGDWESAALLLARLDEVFASRELAVSVLVVDDGSQDGGGAQQLAGPFRALKSVEVLRLTRNLGHQRAIAIGLTFIHQERPCDAVVVMDGDGEDRPDDVLRLYDELVLHGGRKVVFAERSRRSEGLAFRVFYQLYRFAHRVLTGVAVRVGNFSAVPYASLATFVVVSEAWNHYAASVFKARIPYTMVPIARGTRLAGRSTMNFVTLVTHGLSAISVFGDVVGVRLLIAALLCCGVAIGALALALLLRLVGGVEVPASIGMWSAIAFALCLQLGAAAFVCTFVVLASRNNLSFLPVRDYKFFVSRATRVFPPHV
jgi:polyisoprenyl-phosphate glycosyltransferase